MIIIIVGPDGSGKTTLAKKLAKELNYNYIKRDKPETEEDRKDMLESYRQAAMNEDNVIYDRYIYCEQVYGPIMRDASVVTDKQVKGLEFMLLKKGAIIIHCDADISTLWHRCMARGEDYVKDIETLAEIQDLYRHVLKQSTLPVFKYSIGQSMF